MSGPVFIAGLSGTGKAQIRLALLQSDDSIAIYRKTYLWKTVRGRFGDLTEPGQLEEALRAIAAEEGAAPTPADVGELHPEFPYTSLFAAHYTELARAAGKKRWGVQMGGIEQFAGEIFEAIPTARFVHLVADPREQFGPGGSAPRTRRSVRAEAWLRSAHMALAHRMHPAWLTIRTPDLANDPAAVLADVASFLDLEIPDPVAALAGIDFDQLVGHPRTYGRLSPRVLEAMDALGFERGEERVKTVVGFRTLSRKGRSA